MSGTVNSYDRRVPRWDPDSRGRLEQAAMELYGERGFEQTTVAEIAARAGVTERTFFRHYADKREVLFPTSAAMQELLVGAVAAAPADSTPLDAVAAGLEAAAALLQERRDFARRRAAIIGASAELRERELVKLAGWATAVAATLRERGVGEPAASLVAEAAIAAFRIAVERWASTGDDGARELSRHVADAVRDLRAVVR